MLFRICAIGFMQSIICTLEFNFKIKNARSNLPCYGRETMRYGMRTDYSDMIETLLADLDVDQTGLAALMGTTQGTISRWRNGKKPTVDSAKKIEAFWRKTYNEAETIHPRINVVKIVGRIGAGAVVMPEYEQVPPDGLFQVELDFPVREGALAFEVEGDSMWPRCSAGDVIICWETADTPADAIGWEAAVQTDDGRRYIKIVRRGDAPGLFNLDSHNAPPLVGLRIAKVMRVNLIVPRSGWQIKTRAKLSKKLRLVR